MKIAINLIVEVDPESWSGVYGCEATATAVREDVKSYIYNQVVQSAGVEDSEAEVTMK